MSDKDTIAALQRNLAAAEVERLRLVAEVYEKVQALSAVSGVLLGQDVPPTWDVYGAVQDARAANAEVERLREALRDVAERQREACVTYLSMVCNDSGMIPDCLCSPADEVLRATPLVTEEKP